MRNGGKIVIRAAAKLREYIITYKIDQFKFIEY